MKKFLIITGFAACGIIVLSCNRVRRDTGRAYMPDMAYSVAYETYAESQERLNAGATAKNELAPFYGGRPVEGTIARGDLAPYKLKNDTTGYAQSAFIKNPLPPLNATQYLEASRLYLVNCAICHGAKLDGNGPLYNGGSGPYTAAPRNLISDPVSLSMTEGTMYHAMTYGRNAMGSYASQLTSVQRWMIAHYIKEKQGAAAGGAPGAAADSTAKQPKDTAAVQ